MINWKVELTTWEMSYVEMAVRMVRTQDKDMKAVNVILTKLQGAKEAKSQVVWLTEGFHEVKA